MATAAAAGGLGQSSTVDEHIRRLPAEPLRPGIAWYTGYRQRGVAPAVHRGLPSPLLTLIFTLDEPMTMLAHPDPDQRPGDWTTLVGGLHTSPALISHQGAQSGIQIGLRPLGARALLGLPAGELAQLDVPAEAVLGPAGARIHERLRAAPGWPERFAVLDEIFLTLLSSQSAGVAPEVAPELTCAWRLLLRSGGTTSVARLAAATGWSERYLSGRFRAEFGLTPKVAARVIRFDQARHRLVRQPAEGGAGFGLAALAADCGYFDQAHLAREFRELAGCPPSQWLAEEFRNIQAGVWRSGAG